MTTESPTFETVTLNGVEYVPRSTVIPDAVLQHLSALYAKIWPEAYYDSYSESTEKFSRDLWRHIDAINKILRFRK